MATAHGTSDGEHTHRRVDGTRQSRKVDCESTAKVAHLRERTLKSNSGRKHSEPWSASFLGEDHSDNKTRVEGAHQPRKESLLGKGKFRNETLETPSKTEWCWPLGGEENRAPTHPHQYGFC